MLKKKHESVGFHLHLWEARVAQNQRLPAPPPPPTTIDALPAPEALPALLAPPSNEGTVMDTKTEHRKQQRKEIDVDEAQPASGNEGAGKQSSGHHSHQQKESQTVEALLGMAATSVQSSQEVHVEDGTVTVTVTRTNVVVQRVAKVGASQSTTVRTSQGRSTADRSQPPTKRGWPQIKEWEPDFRNQYESFKSAASNG